MANDKIVGVILKSRFVFSSKKFDSYINYIDRDEAVRNSAFKSYSAYVDNYMDNPEKQNEKLGFNVKSERTSALFTETKDRLNTEEKETLKKQFRKAQAADSPMWQNVLSFDNRFLEQHGIYNSKTRMLDEYKIRNITRLAMKEMLKNEGMEASAVWSASIHYNTDNIHVHIAVVEPTPTREKKDYTVTNKSGDKETVSQFKGGLKPGTLLKMKSKVVNNIVDRSEQLKEINDIIRKNIISEKRGNLSYQDRMLKGAFLNLYFKLPRDERLWFYNMNALHDIRPAIDDFTKMYISLYHKEDFQKLQQKLQDEQEFLKTAYGEGSQKMYEHYAENKLNDLYTRMGNTVLTELRQYDKLLRSELSIPKSSASAKQKLRDKYSHTQRRSDAMYQLKKSLKKDFNSVKNQREHEKLQQDIQQAEQENEL